MKYVGSTPLMAFFFLIGFFILLTLFGWISADSVMAFVQSEGKMQLNSIVTWLDQNYQSELVVGALVVSSIFLCWYQATTFATAKGYRTDKLTPSVKIPLGAVEERDFILQQLCLRQANLSRWENYWLIAVAGTLVFCVLTFFAYKITGRPYKPYSLLQVLTLIAGFIALLLKETRIGTYVLAALTRSKYVLADKEYSDLMVDFNTIRKNQGLSEATTGSGPITVGISNATDMEILKLGYKWNVRQLVTQTLGVSNKLRKK